MPHSTFVKDILRIVLSAFWVVTPVGATVTWHVNGLNFGDPLSDGSELHPFYQVQQGISAASAGDTVLVQPGIYPETIDFLAKAISVVARDGPEATILDGATREAPVVMFERGEGRGSVIRGFTIRRGYGFGPANQRVGAGICCLATGPTIDGNVIVENVCHYGGGIYVELGDPLIINNVIADNAVIDNHLRHVAGDGGGIMLFSSSATLANNVIINNSARRRGGGIYVTDFAENKGAAPEIHISNCLIAQNNVTDTFGGALCATVRAILTFRGCTIVANHAFSGDGVYLRGSDPLSFRVAALIENSILYFNGESAGGWEVVAGAYSDATVRYCDVRRGQAGVFVATDATGTWGAGNLDADPLFVDAAAENYRLQLCSPALAMGDPAFVPAPGETDLDGLPRVFGSRVDLGPYERIHRDCDGDGIPDECECPGDLNHDCSRGLADLTLLLAHFGEAGGAVYDNGDLDADGDVDLGDLVELLSGFGLPCS